MSVRFSGVGHTRSKSLRREQILFFGGSTLMFAMMLTGALLIYGSNVVQAREDMIVRPAAESEIAFGTVVLISPSTRVPRGTKITTAHLREIHWPRDQVPEGAVRNMHDVEGMFASAALSANQPVLRGNLAVNPPSFGLGELLPEGHRAVTIRVDAITGVEGWATPGAHVDVYLTYIDPKERVYKTRVAVEDAVVLSYGGGAKKVNQYEIDKTKIESTVTLAVPFEDSLRIQTAKAIGHITLALRNSNDLLSQGRGEFSANDWDGRVQTEAGRPAFVSRGFATFSDHYGGKQQFILGEDEKWWKSGDGG